MPSRPLIGIFIARRASLTVLVILFISAGILHFLYPAQFVRIIPSWFDHGLALVYISGVCEILGGLGILFSGVRRVAGICLIALLIAVFPANIYMALNSQSFANIPVIALWLRLPLQFVLIAWMWSSTVKA